MGRGRIVLLVIVVVAAGVFGVFQKRKVERRKQGAQILDAYVQATGGAQAYQAVRTLMIRGKGTLMGKPVLIQQCWASDPPRCFAMMSGESGSGFIRATDGAVAWVINDMRPEVLLANDREDVLRDAVIDHDVRWREFYKSAECMGIVSFAGRQCHKVVMTPLSGEPRTRYYDPQTGFLVGEERVVTVPGSGPQTQVLTCDNYRKFGGLLIATRQTVTMGNLDATATVEAVDINQAIPDEQFVRPRTVELLLTAMPGYQRNLAGVR
jgi:hypothetical protein